MAHLSSVRLGSGPSGAVSFRKHSAPLDLSSAVQRGKQLRSLPANVATGSRLQMSAPSPRSSLTQLSQRIPLSPEAWVSAL